ncbi:uncharacterized protein LOC144447323 [Glandiceps talaboti]
MAILTNCCCCFNIRTGSLICGYFTLIYSIIYFILAIINLITGSDKLTTGYITSNGIDFLLFLLLLIASILLIIGVMKDKPWWFLTWLIYILVLIVIKIITAIVMLFEGITWNALLNLILFVIFVAFVIYCWLCVFSQFQELRAGRGSAEYHRQARAAGGQPVVVVTSTQKA